MSFVRERVRSALQRSRFGRRLLAWLRIRHTVRIALLSPLVASSAIRRPERGNRDEAVGERETLEIPPARAADGSARPLPVPWSRGRFESLPLRVRRVPGAHLLEEPGAVLTRTRRLLTENLHGRRRAILEQQPLRLQLRACGRPTDRLEAVFVLLGPYSYNYFHWLNDLLPRIEEYEVLGRSEPVRPRLVVPRWLNAWQRRSLELLGIADDEMARLSGDHARARVAFLSSHPGFDVPGLPSAPRRALWLRERLLAAVDGRSTRRERRLFVCRRDAPGRRRIANEEELAEALSTRGFEVVVLSELSFDEQIRRFAEARVVVGAHGAGLSNVLFADAPAVVELVPRGLLRPEYLILTGYVHGAHRLVEAADPGAGGPIVRMRDLDRALSALGV